MLASARETFGTASRNSSTALRSDSTPFVTSSAKVVLLLRGALGPFGQVRAHRRRRVRLFDDVVRFGERAPHARAPDREVHRGEIAEAEQVARGGGRREAGHRAHEALAEQRREVREVGVDRVGVGERHPLAGAEEVGREAGQHREQARADLVGVDLVTREEELLRALAGVLERAGDAVVQPGERVEARPVPLAAARVREPDAVDGGRRRDERRQAFAGAVAERELARRGRVDARQARAGLVGEELLVAQPRVADLEVVADDRAGSECHGRLRGDHRDVQLLPEPPRGRRRARHDRRIARLHVAAGGRALRPRPQPQRDRHGVAQRDPHRHRARLDAADDRSGEDQRERRHFGLAGPARTSRPRWLRISIPVLAVEPERLAARLSVLQATVSRPRMPGQGRRSGLPQRATQRSSASRIWRPCKASQRRVRSARSPPPSRHIRPNGTWPLSTAARTTR